MFFKYNSGCPLLFKLHTKYGWITIYLSINYNLDEEIFQVTRAQYVNLMDDSTAMEKIICSTNSCRDPHFIHSLIIFPLPAIYPLCLFNNSAAVFFIPLLLDAAVRRTPRSTSVIWIFSNTQQCMWCGGGE